MPIKIRVGEVLVIVAVVLCKQVLPQTLPISPSAFGVASVKLSPPDARFTSFSKPGDLTYTATTASLLALLEKAYGVTNTQIIGLPKWSETTNYDVVAKPSADAPFNERQLQEALQQLLKDRFHLLVHHETREVKGFKLVLAKAVPKLQPAQGGPPGRTFVDSDGLEAQNITVDQFCHALQSIIGVPQIKDETGLTGAFKIKVKFATDAEANSPLPSIFTALQEQLGLKLVSATMPTDTIVVDQVDRIPTAN